MEGFYLALLAFGGGYYLLTGLMGHGHGDATSGDEHHALDFLHLGGGDHHLDHGHAASAGDANDVRVSPFSLRSLALFAAAFGGFGYLTQFILSLGLLVGFLVGSAAGLLSVYFMLRLTVWLIKQTGSSHARDSDFWGMPGTTTTSLQPGRVGTVSVLIQGRRESWPARPEGAVLIPAGTKVAVIRKEGSHLVVVPAGLDFDTPQLPPQG